MEYGNLKISEVLRKLRLAAGFRQHDIANALHVERSTYSYYEEGKTEPSIHQIFTIAKIYGVPVEVFQEEGLVNEFVKKDFPAGTRAPRKVKRKIGRIGELTSMEKTLVANVRRLDAGNGKVVRTLLQFAEDLEDGMAAGVLK